MHTNLALLLTAVAGLPIATNAGTFRTYAEPGVYARAVIPDTLNKVPYRVWAPNGDPESPSQWQHTLFASTHDQVQFVIDTHANSMGKTVSAFFNDELTDRTKDGDHINYSILKANWYVISGTNNQGFEFYKKFYALPKGNIAKNYDDYVPNYWVPLISLPRTTNVKSMTRW